MAASDFAFFKKPEIMHLPFIYSNTYYFIKKRQCGQKWLVIFCITVFTLLCQSEEEAGSAGEQPVSNKIDA